jgi:hypothetical protein
MIKVKKNWEVVFLDNANLSEVRLLNNKVAMVKSWKK